MHHSVFIRAGETSGLGIFFQQSMGLNQMQGIWCCVYSVLRGFLVITAKTSSSPNWSLQTSGCSQIGITGDLWAS